MDRLKLVWTNIEIEEKQDGKLLSVQCRFVCVLKREREKWKRVGEK